MTRPEAILGAVADALSMIAFALICGVCGLYVAVCMGV